MTVNEKIIKELEIRGWSSYHLAKLIGTSPSTVKNWVKKVAPTTPSPTSLKKVAKKFDMSLSQLMGEDKIEHDPQKQELNENWNRLSTAEKDTMISVMKAIINHR